MGTARIITPRYVVITPVRDEAPYVEHTIKAMREQTIVPDRWIVVDDGSTDGTAQILDTWQARLSWMTVIHRPDRGHRAAGGGVMEAFYAGYSSLTEHGWEYIVKLDGDLSFDANYFEKCFERFAQDERLGIAGGTICQSSNGFIRVDSPGDPPFHVRGATKIYRRECWEMISPLQKAPGWDTIDEVRANLRGWTTRTLPDLQLVQHKPTGGADGAWRNLVKNGLANYLTGYHPVFMLAKCLRRGLTKPVLIGSIALMAGYLSGYAKRLPKACDAESIDYLRRQQVRRLLFMPSIYG